ncbi:hypothetical protein K461DRAFT_294751 [Myriangium duriaei CBS 260.36]|uniref:Fork-head domain-containing protein n=1 Tax=Myriangium duriaei CBS 260.36 TaxID=1168546 RepID=A0A9P4J3T0_9PEZI|nr:hypothetical protein K461DRAFT_294751 [Myriangium duriaei CBS 260.36]
MPPSSKRGRGGRKPNDIPDHSDAETPESIATPSRPTRKRGRASENVPSSTGRAATRRKVKDTRPAERLEDTEGTEGGDQSDADTEPAIPTEVEVISKLRVPNRMVYATKDFANDLLEGHENVPGYGKIAGRDWTYIIKELEVNIGRPEQHEKVEQSREAEGSQGTDGNASHKSKISIDLGPDRQTSRLHATIAYDGSITQWFIVVNGRNGLRLDTHLLKRGQKAYLRSGSVIDICGTQMAFITTPTAENEEPVFADAIIRQVYTSDDTEPEGDGGGRYSTHPNSTTGGPPMGRQLPGFSDDHPSSTRVHPHSAAANRNSAFATPGTPIRQQAGYQPQYSKPSPASNGYSRGVMIESTESIDYSADSAKDLKPPHSYAQLIGMAILSTPEQQMTLNNIYKWIMANYAFYRFNTGGWQNSIRHNLSLNKAFEKIARRTDEPGKGMKWMIAPKERENFLSQGMKGCRRPNPLPSSVRDGSDPSSPSHFREGFAAGMTNTKSEDTKSPGLNYDIRAYPSTKEAYTPERGSRRPINSLDDNDPELSYYPPSAKSTLNHLTAAAHAAGSPPPLYMNDESRPGMLDTPFPIRSSQKLMPPSTLQRPSTFMEFSSPAPFWKFGSTPLKPLTDISPMKTPFSNFKPLSADIKMDMDDKDDVKIKDADSFQASSPPQTGDNEVGQGSPTRSAHRLLSTKTEPSPIMAKIETIAGQENISRSGIEERSRSASQSQPPQTAPNAPTSIQPAPVQQQQQPLPQQQQQQQQHQVPQQPSSQPSSQHLPAQPGHMVMNTARPQHAHAPNVTMPRFDNDDDDGIDLMKGFQPIGSFHKMGAARFGMGAVGR